MKLVNAKFLFSALIGTGLLTAAAIANAAPLTINNQSSVNLSFQVEHTCSTEFGNVNANSIKTVSKTDLQNACNPHTDVTEHCHVKVYNQPNCTGTHVESIELSTKKGIFLLEGGHPDSHNLAFIAGQFELTVVEAEKK